jgi:hypothetical protein
MISGINTNNSGIYKEEKFGNSNPNISKEVDEIPRKTNSNFRTSNRGFSINKSNHNINNAKQFKDPDVW